MGSPHGDIWAQLFLRARQDRPPNVNEITPFWVFPVEGGAYIERHVPMSPLSREESRYIHLKRSVSIYNIGVRITESGLVRKIISFSRTRTWGRLNLDPLIRSTTARVLRSYALEFVELIRLCRGR